MKRDNCNNCTLCEESQQRYEETGVWEPMRCDNMHMNPNIDIPQVDNNVWQRCTDECYPIDSEDMDKVVLVALYEECDERWFFWMYGNCGNCPYGWNVLCRNEAYWREIEKPDRT